ncbi:Arm DNA-binding domain-containing protein [Jannaschia pohangensis]|uniref:Arm DNA-binding domain-containing protein n=1 Tax=Jannaschia pohangensis TaxID=390807 RepID=UPI001FE09553|nr:Arm DNA-binding domain-containing protein [Jannaschia pohangensis]
MEIDACAAQAHGQDSQERQSGQILGWPGLWTHGLADGGGQWFLRITTHARRGEIGLGKASIVSLKEARDLAKRWRAEVSVGTDPIKERERLRREAARNTNTLTFVAEEAFQARIRTSALCFHRENPCHPRYSLRTPSVQTRVHPLRAVVRRRRNGGCSGVGGVTPDAAPNGPQSFTSRAMPMANGGDVDLLTFGQQ